MLGRNSQLSPYQLCSELLTSSSSNLRLKLQNGQDAELQRDGVGQYRLIGVYGPGSQCLIHRDRRPELCRVTEKGKEGRRLRRSQIRSLRQMLSDNLVHLHDPRRTH